MNFSFACYTPNIKSTYERKHAPQLGKFAKRVKTTILFRMDASTASETSSAKFSLTPEPSEQVDDTQPSLEVVPEKPCKDANPVSVAATIPADLHADLTTYSLSRILQRVLTEPEFVPVTQPKRVDFFQAMLQDRLYGQLSSLYQLLQRDTPSVSDILVHL